MFCDTPARIALSYPFGNGLHYQPTMGQIASRTLSSLHPSLRKFNLMPGIVRAQTRTTGQIAARTLTSLHPSLRKLTSMPGIVTARTTTSEEKSMVYMRVKKNCGVPFGDAFFELGLQISGRWLSASHRFFHTGHNSLKKSLLADPPQSA